MTPNVIYGLFYLEPIGWLVEPFAFFNEQGLVLHRFYKEHLANHPPDAPELHEKALRLAQQLSVAAIAEDLQVPPQKLHDWIQKPASAAKWKLKQLELEKTLDELLQLCKQNQFTVGLNLKRDDLVSSRQLHFFSKPTLKATFEGKEEGIAYTFSLFSNNQPYPLQTTQTDLILNTYGWLRMDQFLVHLPNLKASILSPFFSKPVVWIQPQHFTTYINGFLRKFLRHNAIDIEIINLPVEEISQLSGTVIHIPESILPNQHPLQIQFTYHSLLVNSQDPAPILTRINPNEAETSLLLRVKRDLKKENQILQALAQWQIKPEADGLVLLDQLTPELWEKIKAEVPDLSLQHEAFELTIHTPILHKRLEDKIDWFDVHIQVQVGPHVLPFSAFIPYVKKNNPIFPLPDGTRFHLPSAWFTQWQDEFSQGMEEEKPWKIPKSQLHAWPEFLALPTTPAPRRTLPSPETPPAHFSYRPYQVEGIERLVTAYETYRGFLLADDMGLGKTLMVLSLIYRIHQDKNATHHIPIDLFQIQTSSISPCLIVVPSSLMENWKREITKFFPDLRVGLHAGPDRLKFMDGRWKNQVLITSYGTLRSDIEYFKKRTFSCLVLDEVQALKNPEGLTYLAVQQLQSDFTIGISGTPVENHLTDLWAIFSLLEPTLLGDKAQFLKTFSPKPDTDVWEKLRNKIKPFYLRRTKTEVAPDLPPLQSHTVWVSMKQAQKERYDEWLSAARNDLLLGQSLPVGKKNMMVLRAITRLRQMANHPAMAGESLPSGKFERVMEDLRNLVEAGRKILVFSPFTSHLQIYLQALKAENILALSLTGNTPNKDRQGVIDRFLKEDGAQVLCMSLKAGGVGLNIVAADYVLMLDPWWNPQAESQAIARAHRIGRTGTVTVLRYLTSESVEEKIHHIQQAKTDMADALFGAPFALTTEWMENILQS